MRVGHDRASASAWRPTPRRPDLQAAAIAGIERWRSRAGNPMSDRQTVEAAEIVSRAYEEVHAGRLTRDGIARRACLAHCTTSTGEEGMDTATFYATTSAVSFTLLGFWWVVVQFRHDEMTGDPGRRRLAFVVSLHFILPGLMSLGALLTGDAPIVWRLTFGTAGIAGMIAVVPRLAWGDRTDRSDRGRGAVRVAGAAAVRDPDPRRVLPRRSSATRSSSCRSRSRGSS